MEFFKPTNQLASLPAINFVKKHPLQVSLSFILALWLYPFLPLNPTIPDTYSLLPITTLFKTNPLTAAWITLSNIGGAFETLGIGYVQAIKFLPFSIPL